MTISKSASKILKLNNQIPAEIAQLVEHATENRGVVSSILSLGTTGQAIIAGQCGCSSVVERLLAKEKVESSNLFARSFVPRRRGQVGKARVCKTLITGSSPVDASKKANWSPILGDFCFYFKIVYIYNINKVHPSSLKKVLSLMFQWERRTQSHRIEFVGSRLRCIGTIS